MILSTVLKSFVVRRWYTTNQWCHFADVWGRRYKSMDLIIITHKVHWYFIMWTRVISSYNTRKWMLELLFSLLSASVLTISTPISRKREKKMVIRLLKFPLYSRIKYTSWRSRFANFLAAFVLDACLISSRRRVHVACFLSFDTWYTRL